MVVGFFANLAAMFTVEEFPFELLTAIDKNWVIGPKIKMPILSNAAGHIFVAQGKMLLESC